MDDRKNYNMFLLLTALVGVLKEYQCVVCPLEVGLVLREHQTTPAPKCVWSYS